MTSEFALADQLSAMGMTDAFNSKVADFSGMVNANLAKTEPPVISQVIHKAFVEVDEKGPKPQPPPPSSCAPPQQCSDPLNPSPSAPIIRSCSSSVTAKPGAILFMGRMADPRG